MNLLADEGVDRQIVERLRLDGHSVEYIAEMDPGIPDEAVLAKANESKALLITADKDFGELVYRQNQVSAGVVLLRLAGVPEPAKSDSVSVTFHDHGAEMLESFSVVSPGMIRIRHRL